MACVNFSIVAVHTDACIFHELFNTGVNALS